MQTEVPATSVDSGVDLGVRWGYGLLDYWLSLLPSFFISVSVCPDCTSLAFYRTSALFRVPFLLNLCSFLSTFLYPLSSHLTRYIHVGCSLSSLPRLSFFIFPGVNFASVVAH